MMLRQQQFFQGTPYSKHSADSMSAAWQGNQSTVSDSSAVQKLNKDIPSTPLSSLPLSSSSSSPSENISIDKFNFLNLIGEGAYAKVFLVKKMDNNRVYALKVLKKKKVMALKQENRVILERDILAFIEPHPFIIKLHYTFQNEFKIFFALDFCPGGELFTILNRKNTFDEEQCIFYAAQIVLAIEHLHSQNIIYRDLKPENVILDKDGYIRISDFGLSKSNIDTDHSAHSFCGTPAYLAPEILNQQGHGKPVDWWTLGNMIYEMLTGLPAFYMENQRNQDELFNKIRNEEIKIPQRLSKSCKDILSLLLQKNPYLRLGNKGAEEIKDHPWFADVEWDRMLNKEYLAPFVPKLKHETDVSNFDGEFVDRPLNDSYQDNEVYHEFPNFSFSGSLKDSNNLPAKMDIE